MITKLLPPLVFALLALSPIASAATKTWDGGGDGVSWTNAANWSGDTLPAAGDDVVINVAGTNATINYTTSSLTLRSLQCEETLTSPLARSRSPTAPPGSMAGCSCLPIAP
jgi:hypothetical protein